MNHLFRTILVTISLITLILTSACQSEIRLDPTGETKTQQPLPTSSPMSAYPPLLIVGTAYPIDTPAPYPISTPPPISTRTFHPSLSPTKTTFVTETTVPSPMGYPTGWPWPPPTQTPFMIPHESPTAVIFPTPVFLATPRGKPPAALQNLWYVYAAGREVDPVLQTDLLDASARRWGKGPAVSDLKLEQKAYFSPTLAGLYPSPDGRWVAAIVAQEVSTQLFLIDPVSGKSTRILPNNAFVQFLDWKPDSQRVMVIKDVLSPWLAGEIDLVSGRYQPFEFPPMDGNPYSIEEVEYFPDGRWMADAIVYQSSVRDRKYVLSIGLWDTQTQVRKTLQEIPLAQGIIANSLVWSLDGNSLFWISRTKTGNDWSDRDVQTELWVSDRATGETKAIGRLEGFGVNRGWVEWSPDRKKLALVIVEEQEDGFFTGNIFLLDPFSGVETQVSHFNQMGVTHLQWSKDGQWIFCNVSDQLSGAIWAVNVTSGQSFPVAGPVITRSPFALLP
jgi:hypothetical protein